MSAPASKKAQNSAWNETLQGKSAVMRERMILLSGKDYVSARISREAVERGLATSHANRRKHGDALRNSVTEIVASEPRSRLRGPLTPGDAGYPACPWCPGAKPGGTIRAGFAKGIQRYRCSSCRKTFSGGRIFIKVEPFDYKMICYHCGGTDVIRAGKGISKSRTGRVGECRKCRRKFVQGGLKDYRKYHLVLEKRIAELNLPLEVEAEILQAATMDVLAGKGYCWSVDLKVKEAWNAVRGEFGQRGSDHPEFRRQAGQKAYDD